MDTAIFISILGEVRKDLGRNSSLSLHKIITNAMDNHHVPDNEDTRDACIHAILIRLAPEEKERNLKSEPQETKKASSTNDSAGERMFSKKVWEKIKEGAKGAELRESTLKAIVDEGTISRENLEGKYVEKEEHEKLKEIGFLPPIR